MAVKRLGKADFENATMAEEPKKSGEILSFEQEIYMVVNGISTVGRLKFGEAGWCWLS